MTDQVQGESFADLFEQSVKEVKEGEVVEGTVAAIDSDHVQVDVGFKSEGLVDAWEFMNEDGTMLIKVGDVVDVLVESTEDEEGRIVLSKEKADRVRLWNTISDAYDEDRAVEGTIVSRVKGGLAVDIGVKAFLPGSQVDLRPIRNLEDMLGKRLEFKIIKFNQRRGNIVLSRRVLLEKERKKLREETLGQIQEDQIVDGVIKNLTDYGAFIDLGGIDGLLHVTDMSWGRVNHPSELFQVGEEIKVKVLKFDQETERVSLGLKQIQPDPWVDASMRYPIGKRVSGKVVALTDYGAFLELEAGIEGLIHVSEMSWTKRVKHPSKVVSQNDVVEAVVLDVDESNRKISLGMKQIEENHVSDISWTEQIKHPSEKFQKGDELSAVVLKIDKDNEKFSLGIKQLEANPWNDIQKRYPMGTEIQGEVTNVTDFGAFVKLEEGIEGLIYSSELSAEPVEKPTDVVTAGETVTALITKVDPGEQKISLSIRALTDKAERAALKKVAKEQSRQQTATLGDLLKEKMAEKEAETSGDE
ncbi:MAG: 30S ribosomal protein S1 [Deltaproteobacteria bacterium]|nr:30S ribosomal protein S1 [Deltaproteobacteria bacterium]